LPESSAATEFNETIFGRQPLLPEKILMYLEGSFSWPAAVSTRERHDSISSEGERFLPRPFQLIIH
jgi:hypothetical protein